VDAAAAATSPRLRAATRAAPSPKGRPGAPRQGSGGHVHAAPAMGTIARVVMRRPTPPGPPAQGGNRARGDARTCSARPPSGRQRRKSSCRVACGDGECACARARTAWSPGRRRRRPWWDHPCCCFLILQLYTIGKIEAAVFSFIFCTKPGDQTKLSEPGLSV
jgi:hypothetical protein